MKVHEMHKHQGPKELNIGLIVVSTTRYNELLNGKTSSDKTIPAVENVLSQFPNIKLIFSEIIPDSEEFLDKTFHEFVQNSNLDAIIFSGGTGLSPKDITYEVISPYLQKKIEGFGEIFRYLSYKDIGSSAMLSRALAGIYDKKIIFLLPGSPNAVVLALEKLIIPELGHITYLINKEE